MKKSIFILALSNFVAVMLGISCKSDTDIEAKTDYVEVSPEAMQQAKEDEMLEEILAKKIAYSDSVEWNTYKNEVKNEIEINKKLINNLKLRIGKTTKKYDGILLENVKQIEKENSDLLVKVNSYTISRENDWEDFKKELEYQLEELDKSIDSIKSGKKSNQ